LGNTLALAQHTSDVQRLVADRDYYEALKLYQVMPERKKTSETMIAAAKSAWAMSLPQKAIDEFEKALRDNSLTKVQRARLLLSRGVIEFQEDRFRVAILFAERVVETLNEASPLRSKAWLLWAEALSKLKSYGAAEDKYQKALKECDLEDSPNIFYALGSIQLKLGKLDESRKSFEHIPLQNANAPLAIRKLAEIALQEKKFKQAGFWLAKGKEEFPEQFVDSWVEYVLLQVAIYNGDREAVLNIQKNAENKFPPSDEWISLLNAAVEEFMWNDNLVVVKN